jgi:hypothetical protein
MTRNRVPWLALGLVLGCLLGPTFLSGASLIGIHAHERLSGAVIGLLAGLAIDLIVGWRRW